MVGTLVHQLSRNASIEEIEKSGLSAYYTDHGLGVYPQSAGGYPFNAVAIAVKGDPVADLTEDLAAEQKDYKCNYFLQKIFSQRAKKVLGIFP